jgi:hypothetical protein
MALGSRGSGLVGRALVSAPPAGLACFGAGASAAHAKALRVARSSRCLASALTRLLVDDTPNREATGATLHRTLHSSVIGTGGIRCTCWRRGSGRSNPCGIPGNHAGLAASYYGTRGTAGSAGDRVFGVRPNVPCDTTCR